ncbi:hypothetical protein L226DRAFT_474024 [Lentinus tigrinus ALCF2SS1-7]|uniref:HAT C-terminal dimerisation domain-containing protein n=1 Tax=Lentinus tigrinus ALCF2SS1-6 TaxID=1328759 RepID=A0A5C2RNK7_9APHY|nr:hypothetical protein L227DRAFT_514406 [Lentinus tigrinus ALCF2SS1-6]RPD68039.1 hypothetical protein L226DRAFT_474024 [Lentinus tigrinus ALCF2SS1-7]
MCYYCSANSPGLIVLHPRYKSAYFKRQKWPQSWIDTAISLLREEWQWYKPAPKPTAASGGASGEVRCSSLYHEHSSSGIDALEEYLISPPLPSVTNPILHWHSLDGEHNPLARMALDILSTPGKLLLPSI